MIQYIDKLFYLNFCWFGIESDYNFEETPSDVLFIINGQPLKALKSKLIDKNNVFKAMFSGNFKESKDNEVVIEDTTFEAFKTLILFLYYNEMFLNDYNDYELIEEIYKLSERYECPQLNDFIVYHLHTNPLCYESLESITKFAFKYDIQGINEKVLKFVENNLFDLINKVINELQDTNHKILTKLLVTKYRKMSTKLTDFKKRLDLLESSRCSHCALNMGIYLDNYHYNINCRSCIGDY